MNRPDARMITSRHRVTGLAAICAAGMAGAGPPARAAPQTFNTALPVASGEFIFREQFFYIKSSDDPGPADRDLEVVGAVSVLGYGASPDLALFGAVPLLDKRLELDGPGGRRIARDTSGVGDVRLFGRYTVFQDDAPGRNFRIAPFAGVELPTGDDDDRDALGRLPQPLQLGSGSFDPFFGVVGTWQTLDYQIDGQASYEVNTEANGFEFGDVLRFDASLQYRLWPQELGPGVPGFLYGVLEGNLIFQGENEVAGGDDPDSGGTTFFLAPGLQYVTKRWVLEAIAQLPAVQDLNGDALESDYVVRAGFRFNF